MTQSALVVIDMQEGFLARPTLPLKIRDAETKRQVKNIAAVLLAGAQVNVPTVFVEYKGKGPTLPELLQAAYRPESSKSYGIDLPKRGVKIVEREKSDDAFEESGLEAVLKKQGCGELVMMGVNASQCVKETVYGALMRAFSVVTSLDLLSDLFEIKGCVYAPFYQQKTLLMPDHKAVISYLQGKSAVNMAFGYSALSV